MMLGFSFMILKGMYVHQSYIKIGGVMVFSNNENSSSGAVGADTIRIMAAKMEMKCMEGGLQACFG